MNLTHRFLLASPTAMDGYFSQSLVYICEHNKQGAMGFVVNKKLGIKLGDVFKQMSIVPGSLENVHWDVMSGGPVAPQVGFVLYSLGPEDDSIFDDAYGIGVATSPDILKDIAIGKRPEKFLVAVGYTGWAAGQLENEIRQKAWLSCPADLNILFDTDVSQRLEAVGQLIDADLGISSTEIA